MASNFSIESALRSHQPRTQQSLKATMKDEIGNQVFSFPSVELARILSPKTPKSGVNTSGQLLHINDYDCEVDKERFTSALDTLVEGDRKLLKPFERAPGSAEAPC